MSAIEQSLRRALSKGEASDPQFRRRIYEAALRAHDRLIAERGLDAAAQSEQRRSLIAAIETIETEHAAPPGHEEAAGGASAEDAGERPVEAEDHPDGATGGSPANEESFSAPYTDDDRPVARRADPDEPLPGPGDVAAEPVPSGDMAPMEPVIADRSGEADRGSGGGPIREGRSFDVRQAQADSSVTGSPAPLGAVDESWRLGTGGEEAPPKGRAPKSSRPSRGLFFWVAVLAALIALLFLAYIYFGSAPTGGDPVAPPEEAAETVPATGSTQAAIDDGWIDVFSGDQLQSISTPGGGRVVAVSRPGDAPAVRIEGPEGAEGVEIMVPIGPGLIDRLAGHMVRGEVTVGTPDENPREFGVRCLFDGETACGRQRFSTALPSESFVFDMDVPADPGETASLAIDPGFGSEGRNLDLYSIRLRVLD